MTVQYDQPTPAGIHSGPSQVDGGPPKRSRLTVALAAVACAACCAVPVLLVSAGVLTATGAAVLSRSLAALSVGLLAAAGAMWWLHRRRSARRAGAAASGGCGGPAGACDC